MTFRRENLLLTSLFIISMLLSAAASEARYAPPTQEAPRYSVSHPMIDFYAKGTSSNGRVEISPKGGTVQIGAQKFSVIPWEYVMTYLNGNQVWVILFANVTATDFTIMYTYLWDDPTPFYLKGVTYSDGRVWTYQFSGSQKVSKNIVATPSVQMPDLRFIDSSISKSKFAAFGSDLYLNEDAGLLVNGTETLKIYPICNQVFTAPDASNEVWVLAKDSLGKRWFSILYFTSSDPDHVTMAHTLRLDDLQTAPPRTVNAKWTRGKFSLKLQVQSPIPNSVIKLDGFPFEGDAEGRVSAAVSPGNHTISVPPAISEEEGVRSSFKNWSDGNSDNPRGVEIRTDATFIAVYEREFSLKVVSELKVSDVDGWYKNGTLVRIAIPPVYSAKNGTRFTLVSWAGDVSPSAENGTVLMNAPKVLTLGWKKQLPMTFRVEGLPETLKPTLTVAGVAYSVNPGEPSDVWVDSNSTFAYDLSPHEFTDGQTKYVLERWNSPAGAATGNWTALWPTSFAASYGAVFETSTQLEVSPTVRMSAEPLKISGAVSNVNEVVTVNLYYSTDRAQWQLFGSIQTDSKGTFNYEWSPSSGTMLYVKATYAGDVSHEGSSSNVIQLVNWAG